MARNDDVDAVLNKMIVRIHAIKAHAVVPESFVAVNVWNNHKMAAS